VAGWEADPKGKRHHRPGPRARKALAVVFQLHETDLFAPEPATAEDATPNPT
jgi:hypothetical protein